MNAKNTILAIVISSLGLLAAAPIARSQQGSAFTYQGRLTEGGNLANGVYDLQCSLFDAVTNGNLLSAEIVLTNVPAVNGLFSVALDFGADVFNGNPRWLEIAVRNAASTNSFTILQPRQPITVTPYAIHATIASSLDAGGAGLTNLNAGNLASGSVPDARLGNNIARLNTRQVFTGSNIFSGVVTITNSNNSYAGDGSGLFNLRSSSLSGILPDSLFPATVLKTDSANMVFSQAVSFNPPTGPPFIVGNTNRVINLNADFLDGLGATDFWQRHGNAGTTAGSDFVGTTDNQALELRVNQSRAMRLEPYATGNSVAGGNRAKAAHPGSFVWADTNAVDFSTTANNQFRVRAVGGTELVTSVDAAGVPVNRVAISATGGVSISSSNTALEILSGSIKVTGAGVGKTTPVYIHRSTVDNVYQNLTILDHPLCNGDPKAIIIATPNFNPGDTTGTNGLSLFHAIGVYYTGTFYTNQMRNHWTIYNQDNAAMLPGVSFNVIIIKP